MSGDLVKRQPTAVEKLKEIIKMPSIQEQFNNALKDSSSLFVASLIDVYSSDDHLQKCEPKLVIMEALKAATLKLPINKNLGFAYIVPYKAKPNFQIGYKGYIQLAQRTGQYRHINADVVFEGEFVSYDKLSGELDITGDAKSKKVVGYFAHFETIPGFRKTIYWSVERVRSHAERYAPSYQYADSPWKKTFDEMAIKTVLKNLISHYGIMSVEMVAAINADVSPEDDIDMNANSADFIEGEIVKEPKPKKEKKKEDPPKDTEPKQEQTKKAEKEEPPVKQEPGPDF
jgi:recombination protein RecT